MPEPIEDLKSMIWEMIPDRFALALQYKSAHGRFPNLVKPEALSEKIQWRKLNDRDPRLPLWADKAKVKMIVSQIIGDQYIIPTLWSGPWLDKDVVPHLPRPFIIKPSHSSGEVIIVRQGDEPDWEEIRLKTWRWMQAPFGARAREWLYQHIERGIIIEPMIGDGATPPVDFKFYVFHGKVSHTHVDFGRFGESGRTQAIMDRDWHRLPVLSLHPGHQGDLTKPDGYEEMLSIAEQLGRHFDFVRIDLYNIDGKVYFGEATFYPASGYAPYHPRSFDVEMGKLWKL